MPVPLLDIAALTFEADHHPILNRLDLSTQPGEIHALLGANGSGKTTLAYVLMGCEGYVPSGGRILFNGTDLLPLKMYERARLGRTLAWQDASRRCWRTLPASGYRPNRPISCASSSTCPLQDSNTWLLVARGFKFRTASSA